MTEKDSTADDTLPYEIPADWDSFTSEIQAVAAKKQRRLTIDKALFYVWSGVLITAIALLFWLLNAQKREQNALVERETKRLQEQVAAAQAQIEDTRKTASEKVEELAKDSILKDAAVRRLFDDLEKTLSLKVHEKGTELKLMNEELGKQLTAGLNDVKSGIEKDKLEVDKKIKDIKDLSESLAGKLADKVDQSRFANTLEPIQTELKKATIGLADNRKRLNEEVEMIVKLLNKKDQTLESYAKTANVTKQLELLRQEMQKELSTKADKPKQ